VLSQRSIRNVAKYGLDSLGCLFSIPLAAFALFLLKFVTSSGLMIGGGAAGAAYSYIYAVLRSEMKAVKKLTEMIATMHNNIQIGDWKCDYLGIGDENGFVCTTEDPTTKTKSVCKGLLFSAKTTDNGWFEKTLAKLKRKKKSVKRRLKKLLKRMLTPMSKVPVLGLLIKKFLKEKPPKKQSSRLGATAGSTAQPPILSHAEIMADVRRVIGESSMASAQSEWGSKKKKSTRRRRAFDRGVVRGLASKSSATKMIYQRMVRAMKRAGGTMGNMMNPFMKILFPAEQHSTNHAALLARRVAVYNIGHRDYLQPDVPSKYGDKCSTESKPNSPSDGCGKVKIQLSDNPIVKAVKCNPASKGRPEKCAVDKVTHRARVDASDSSSPDAAAKLRKLMRHF